LKLKPYLRYLPRIARNISAFCGPIASTIGPFADNEYCDVVLNGTCDFEDLSEMTEVHDLIAGMRYPDPMCKTPSIDTTLM
jgi:hypothetical protein